MSQALPRVFIIGGGFAGIAAAKALAKAPAEITLLDRRNHHVFQPLLYQVATASLSPAEIASPIRYILQRQSNVEVALVEVRRVELEKKLLHFEHASVRYDYLIIAAGATHSYFGHDDWASLAPGLKTLEDATELRRRILLAFESAEYEASESARRAALSFAIVGGGPTGVELAGAIKEIAAQSIPKDFRHIDTRTAQVMVFEGEDRVLAGFPPKLSARALRDLTAMGVHVRLNARVTNITPEGLYVGEDFIPVRTVFWAAGVKANPLGASMGVSVDRAGRVIVSPDLSVPGHPEVFVVGDLAAARSAGTGELVPGVAQAALQMGRYAGRAIAAELGQQLPPGERKPFRYRDKGVLATIGTGRAVARIGRLNFAGLLAWILWGLVHIFSLINFRNRIQVMLNWFWAWVINARDARLIMGEAHLHIERPRNA